MILDLARQGLSVSAISRRTGHDRKTIRKYIARGMQPPAYTAACCAAPSLLAPFQAFLRERLARFPELTGRRLWREIGDLGFTGGYSTVTDFLRAIRPPPSRPPSSAASRPRRGARRQVDFAFFKIRFTDEPGAERIVWLFSLVLGHSRMMWARFVARQDLATVLRCHVAAFEALGGVPEQILYDRMKTAVLGESRRPRHRLQRQAAGPRRALRLRAQGLPSLPGQDQGQGRAAVPLRPRGLLPRPQLPQPRGPERPVQPVARPGRQPPPAWHHRADRRRALRRGAGLLSSRCRPGPFNAVLRPRAPDLARGHGLGRRQSLLRPRRHPPPPRRGPGHRHRGPHPRGRAA